MKYKGKFLLFMVSEFNQYFVLMQKYKCNLLHY